MGQNDSGVINEAVETMTQAGARITELVEMNDRNYALIIRQRAALKACKRLFDEALPKFDWGNSALDANAIGLLNDVPILVARLLDEEGEAG